jgi:cytochrome c biogenesis protein CcmG, thiol:disulfide interchange protein DsbE
MSSTNQSKREQREERRARQEEARRKAKRRDRLQLVLGGAVLLAAVFGIVLAISGSGGGGDGGRTETGEVTVAGDALPPIPQDPGTDPAVGQPAPPVTGQNFDGEEVELLADGQARIVTFLAHWCPVCNREVPVIVDTFDPATMPDGVEFVAVSTGVSPGQPNYPPSQWLEARNWEFGVLADSETNEIASAYGVTAYPAFVVVGADGNVIVRSTGELPAAQLQAFVAAAAETV